MEENEETDEEIDTLLEGENSPKMLQITEPITDQRVGSSESETDNESNYTPSET